ncbi:MAG: hypothetical protein IJA06_07710 [Oscillospiraceae bacterium]|nr:hypothetical protein [Oscillospiraceae bacterium]
MMEFLSVDFMGRYKIINLKAVYQQFFVLQVVFKAGTSPCFMAKQQVLAMSKGWPGVAARKRPHCLKGAGFFNRLRLKKTGGFFYKLSVKFNGIGFLSLSHACAVPPSPLGKLNGTVKTVLYVCHCEHTAGMRGNP